MYYCLSRVSLFCREFAGVTGLVFKAIRGRDGCTRDFGHGRHENLSGAISWLTFFAGGAADVSRSRSDCTRFHRWLCARGMNDALHGREAWRRPGKRDRDRRREVGAESALTMGPGKRL